MFWPVHCSDAEEVFGSTVLLEEGLFLEEGLSCGEEETKSPEVTSWELDVPMQSGCSSRREDLGGRAQTLV